MLCYTAIRSSGCRWNLNLLMSWPSNGEIIFGLSQWIQGNQNGPKQWKRKAEEVERSDERTQPAGYEDRGRGHEPRNEEGLWELEKARKGILLWSLQKGSSPANTPMSVQPDPCWTSSPQYYRILSLLCQATKFTVICYSSNTKLIHQLNVLFLSMRGKYGTRNRELLGFLGPQPWTVGRRSICPLSKSVSLPGGSVLILAVNLQGCLLSVIFTEY